MKSERTELQPLQGILCTAVNLNSSTKAGEVSATSGLKNESIEKKVDSENNLRIKCLLLGPKKSILYSFIWLSLRTKSKVKPKLAKI